MALSSEFSKCLNSNGEPLAKRLRLAQPAFESSALPVLLKDQLILGWLSSSDPSSEDVWLVLQAYISADRTTDLSPAVASSIVRMVCEGLKCDMGLKNTIKSAVCYTCARKILDSNVFRWNLKKGIKDYLDLIVIICDRLEDCDAFVKTIHSIKEFYSNLVENKDEFVEGFVRHALFPLLKSYNIVKSTLLVRENVNPLLTILTTMLQEVLFPEQECNKRTQYLDNLFSGENMPCDVNCVLPVVFRELHAAPKKFPISVCTTGFCVVLQSFINAHSTDCGIIIKYISVCFHLVGFMSKVCFEADGNKLTVNSSLINEIAKPLKLKVVSYVLAGSIVKTLTEINFVVDGDYEECFVNLLLGSCMAAVQKSKSQNISAEYLDMCSSVICYSPVAMAPRMFEFLVPVMLCNKCGYLELSVAYLGFLHSALVVFFKLSRVQKLFTKILPLIRDALQERNVDVELNDVLPKDFCMELCMVVMQLPSQQIFSLMKSFCYHLQEDCVSPLVQGKSGGTSQLYVQILARLTSTFLLGVRVACHSVPAVVLSKFSSQLVELKEILARYAVAMLAHKFVEGEIVGLLEMCHSVGELCLLLANYSSRTWRVNMSQADTSVYNLAGLHPYITSEQWNIITQRINSSDQNAAKEKINELLLQKLVALQLFDSTGDSRMQQSTIARHFVSSPLVHVTKLLSNLPLLSQLLDKQDVLILTRNLIQAVTSCQDVHGPVLAALQREVIREDKEVTQTLLWVILEQIGSILVLSISDKTVSCPFHSQEMLTTFFLNRFSQSESSKDALSPMLASLGNVVTLACKEGGIFQSDTPELINMKILELHVSILKTLPVTFMPVDVQSLTTLTVVLVAACLSKNDPKNALIDVLCGDIILGLLENTKALNLSEYVQISSFFCWLFAVGADFETQRLRLLFRRLFDNHFMHKGKLKDLQPMLSSLTVANSSREPLFGMLSALLSSLRKHGKKQLCKKEKFTQKVILLPVATLIDAAKAGQCELNGAMVEVFANLLMLELGMTELVVTKCYLTEFINIALAGLGSDDDDMVQNSTLFIKLLLQHREKLSNFLPQDFVHKVWATGSTHVNEQQVKLVVEAASDEEFDMIITSLLHKTEDRLVCRSPIGVLMLWWKCVVSCSLPAGKCAARLTAVDSLCISLLTCLDHYYQEIVEILKMEEALISNPQVRMGPHMMDLCMQSISSIPSSVVSSEFLLVWPAMLSVLHQLHTHSSVWLWDRLPSVLQCYRQLFSTLAAQSDINRDLAPLDVHQISTSALGLTKFTNSLATSSHHLKRVCPYLIADILHEIETHTVHPSVKVHFQNCINYLLSMSDMNAVKYLLRVLEPAECELFKSMYQTYKKYFQFTGKI